MSTLSSCRFEELSFYRLLTCLEEIRHKLEEREDDFILCSSYFQSRDFRKFFQFPTTASSSADRILCSDEELTAPGLQNSKRSLEIAQEIVDTLLPCSLENTEGQELQHILTKPHVKGLLQAHDAVAAGDVPSISVRDEVTDILGANVDMTRTEKLPSKTLHSKSQENEGDDSVDVAGNSDDNNDDDSANDKDNDDIDSGGESDLGEEADKAKDGEVHESSSETEVDSDDSHCKSSHYIPSLSDNKHVIEVQIQVNKNDGLFGAADNAHHNDGSFPGDNDSTMHANVTHNFIDSKEQETWNKEKKVDSFPTKTISEETRTSIEDECVILKDIRKETDLDEERKGSKKEKISFSSKAKSEQNIEAQVTTGSENATKTVTLFRNAKETLGITVKAVKNSDDNVRILVARILRGGLADNFGSLHVGDEILEISGKQIRGMTANEVAEIMDGITGNVDIKINPIEKDRNWLAKETKVSVRAFFDYNPLQDPLIPCKEVGVEFSTGDILHVVNVDDGKWWQARKDGCSHDKAGLIPSKDFQEKRQQFNKISTASNFYLQKDKNVNTADVLQCFSLGAPGVGRNEVKKQLLTNSPQSFITTVPHTSRHMRSHETNGKEYFFVSRETMENFIHNKKLIEFGEYKGCLYGTSKDSITRVLKTGKTCVLKVQPEVMLLLRTAEFKPYCIYIKPPSLKELRASRLTVQGKTKPSSSKSNIRTFKEEDLQEMINASRELEEHYGKLFDLTVVNKNIDEAYDRITEAMERLEREEHWVPEDWVRMD
ncbi:PREDICTED: MAGUK p55 subfamily member 5-like [Acropora digitifera]|uniref:MAGUK p55 subfamily member 5-like n=1 Tax=Acropora digitifera TaxID=70779 RepID=UPI00077A181A|nr:PREDICTED: MAGUK p55 subfamily member 5-like [Acropora digitifera]